MKQKNQKLKTWELLLYRFWTGSVYSLDSKLRAEYIYVLWKCKWIYRKILTLPLDHHGFMTIFLEGDSCRNETDKDDDAEFWEHEPRKGRKKSKYRSLENRESPSSRLQIEGRTQWEKDHHNDTYWGNTIEGSLKEELSIRKWWSPTYQLYNLDFLSVKKNRITDHIIDNRCNCEGE